MKRPVPKNQTSQNVVELHGIEPRTSTLPVVIDNLYTQVNNVFLNSRYTTKLHVHKDTESFIHSH